MVETGAFDQQNSSVQGGRAAIRRESAFSKRPDEKTLSQPIEEQALRGGQKTTISHFTEKAKPL
jgi:hypothetical protein